MEEKDLERSSSEIWGLKEIEIKEVEEVVFPQPSKPDFRSVFSQSFLSF